MHEEDLKELQCVEEILEKDLRAEIKKVKDAGTFSPGQTKTLCEAVDLMLKMKEYEEWLSGMGVSKYSQRNSVRNPYSVNSYGMPAHYVDYAPSRGVSYTGGTGGYGMSYGMDYSGHSTKDRMIARLEDMMGEAKNEYEARMIRDAIARIQNDN